MAASFGGIGARHPHPPALPGSCSPPRNSPGRCPACRGVPPPTSSCPPPCGYRQCHPSSESAPCRPERGPQPELRSSWILLPFRPCSANLESPPPSGDAHCGPALRSPPECRAGPPGDSEGAGREGHLLGGLCLEVKLEPGSLPLCRGKGQKADPGQAGTRTHPGPYLTLPPALPSFPPSWQG